MQIFQKDSENSQKILVRESILTKKELYLKFFDRNFWKLLEKLFCCTPRPKVTIFDNQVKVFEEYIHKEVHYQ